MTEFILLHEAEVRLGDTVILTDDCDYVDICEGHTAIVIELDPGDEDLPFRVRWEGDYEDEDEWPEIDGLKKFIKSVMDSAEFSEVNKEKETL